MLRSLAHGAAEEGWQQVVLRQQPRALLKVHAEVASEHVEHTTFRLQEGGDVGIHLRHQESGRSEAGAEVVLGHLSSEGAIRKGFTQHIEGRQMPGHRILHDKSPRLHYADGGARCRHCRGDRHTRSGHVVQHDTGRKFPREVRGDHDGNGPAGTLEGFFEGPGAEIRLASVLEILRWDQDTNSQEVHQLLPPVREPSMRQMPAHDARHENMV
mmetsp:Transcript_26352/g.61708  ORF Transcript_26352/g.61708 Transcript_26352/m.61708 type:complete len:213 (+) Transcript_26352:388-1026(+)